MEPNNKKVARTTDTEMGGTSLFAQLRPAAVSLTGPPRSRPAAASRSTD